MKKAKCPVCKRTDHKVQLVHVPLGHGRFCEYICCECKIVFPYGFNKFGDIWDTEVVKEVRQVYWGDKIKKEDHPDFTEEIYCVNCNKQITHEERTNRGQGWRCGKKCKV